jgi:pimeloyl-ACP methyl ester carboxylesterase
VLLHGLGSSAAVWDQLVEPLSLGLRVWTFEMPGHGKTQPIHQPTIEKMADLLGEFIKTNKIYKPILVGHSMGGMVALSYALDNPSQVYKLIVIDATPKQLATENQKAAVRDQLITNYDHFISDFFMNMSPLPDVTDQILDQAMRTHQGTMTNMLLSSFDFDLTDELYYQSIPILVIGSGMMFPDPTVAQQQLDMMGYENAQTISFKSMHNSGTFLMLEQPNYLASIILAYSVIHKTGG